MPTPNSRSRCAAARPSIHAIAQAAPVNVALAAAAAAAQNTASMAASARRSGRTRHIGQGERHANANRMQAGPSTAVLRTQLAPPDAHIRSEEHTSELQS